MKSVLSCNLRDEESVFESELVCVVVAVAGGLEVTV